MDQEPIGKREAQQHLHTPRVPTNPLPRGGRGLIPQRQLPARALPPLSPCRKARCRRSARGAPRQRLTAAGFAPFRPGPGRRTRDTTEPVGRSEGGGCGVWRKMGGRSPHADPRAVRGCRGSKRCGCRSSAARGGWGAAPRGRARAAATTGRRALAGGRQRRE